MPVHDRHHALALNHLEAADRLLHEGQHAYALEQFRRAAEALGRTDDPPLEHKAWTRAGLCALEVGDLDASSELLRQAVAVARSHGLRKHLAVALGHLGGVESRRGAVGEAGAAYHEALELATDLGEGAMEASVLGNLGYLALRRGALAEARARFDEALARYTALGSGDGTAGAQMALGEVARAAGDAAEAQRHFRRALDTYGAEGSVLGNASALRQLGNLARDTGDLRGARHLLEASLRMATYSGHDVAVAQVAQDLGNLSAVEGDMAAAHDQYESALELYEELGDAQAVAGLQVNLANLLAGAGRLEDAGARYRAALTHLRALRARRTAVDVACLLGQVEARLGRVDEAEGIFKDAQREAAACEHRAAEARLFVNLAAIAYARGDLPAGLRGFRAGAERLEALGRAADAATPARVVADAMIACGQLAEAGAEVERARALLGAAAPRREHLDCDVLAARVDYLERLDAPSRQALLRAAAALDAAGRGADAAAARLVVADQAADAAEDRAFAEAARAAAAELGLRPLAIDAESLQLALSETPTGGAIDRLRALIGEVEAMPMALLALRLRRRLTEALLRGGGRDEAAALRASTLSQARGMGALAEVARLEALAP